MESEARKNKPTRLNTFNINELWVSGRHINSTW